MPGHDDDLGLGAGLADLGQDLDPGQARHLDVEQGDVERALLQRLDRGGPVGADGDLVADPGQLHLHQVAEVGLVVGEEDAEAALMRLVHDWSSLSVGPAVTERRARRSSSDAE